ncbi:FecR family protein [Gaoshiqia sp. Z1-71]|uniref:FecR family protein n=1 Tax=Gaoshiqia hydrogeniformans TaxID=3290090 RepID=UPI003BF90FBA
MNNDRVDHIDKIINRFLQKDAGTDELQELDKWMEETSNKQRLKDYLKIWLWAGQMKHEEPAVSLTDTWERIREKQLGAKSKKLSLKTFLRYAAVVFVLLNAGWWGARFYYQERDDAERQIFTVSANRLNNSVITLPDQTLVYLRPGTSLQYDSRFNKKHRQVSLDGEAFFEVTRDETNPFTVHTGQADIKVLGTSFNVFAQEGSGVFQATLVEGKIELRTNLGEQYLLEPNQLFEWNAANNEVRIKQVNTDLYTAWKDGKIIFRDATLGEITRNLEAIYHVKFIYRNKSLAGNYRFSGTFHYETSIGDVITMLKISIPMKVQREERFPEPDLIYLE